MGLSSCLMLPLRFSEVQFEDWRCGSVCLKFFHVGSETSEHRRPVESIGKRPDVLDAMQPNLRPRQTETHGDTPSLKDRQ